MSAVSTGATAPADSIDVAPRERGQKLTGFGRQRQGQLASGDAAPAGKGNVEPERRLKSRAAGNADAVDKASSQKSRTKIDGDDDLASFVEELGRLEKTSAAMPNSPDNAAPMQVVAPLNAAPANSSGTAPDGASESAPARRMSQLRLPIAALGLAARTEKAEPLPAADVGLDIDIAAIGEVTADAPTESAFNVVSDAVDDAAAFANPADDPMVAPDARYKLKVTSQEAHFTFAPSSYAMSARTVAGLALARTEPASRAGEVIKVPKIGAANDVDAQDARQIAASPQAPAPSGNAPGTNLANAFGSGGGGASPETAERQMGQPVEGEKPTKKVEAGSRLSGIDGSFAKATQSPVQQLVDHIVDATTEAKAAVGDAAMASPAQKVLRKLDITLQPPNLGEVQIKLALSANALDVQISATKPEVAQMLSHDRRGLDSGLKDAGYELSTYSVTVAAQDTYAAISAASPSFSNPGSTDPSLSGNQGSASQQQAAAATGEGAGRDRGQARNSQQSDQSAAPQRPNNPNAANTAGRPGQIYV